LLNQSNFDGEEKMAKMNFDLMWKNFPDHHQWPTMGALYRHIGGDLVDAIAWDGFGENGNTCATRMSRALNYGGVPIDLALLKSLKLSSLTGADKKHYIYRVGELKTYLKSALGVPSMDKTPPIGDIFSGKKGVVAIDVRGWRNASGHIALWNGSQFIEPSHDDYIARDAADTTYAVTGASLWKA
jgi:Type VI secretion system (T6SS), amidase effector protein 4